MKDSELFRRLFFSQLFILIAILCTACNFIVHPLHGRENGDDPEAQIYNLFAFQTGEEEITASFTWRDVFYNYDEKTAIEEAVLVYNIGEALPVRSIPLPPGSGGTVGFDFRSDTYSYSKVVEGITEGDTIWFALYPKTKRRWLAPLYESVTVRDYPPAWEIEPFLIVERGFRSDPSSRLVELTIGENYPIDGSFEGFAVLQFDIPSRVFVNAAFLYLNTGGSGTVGAYPVTFKHVNGIEENILKKFIDTNNGSLFTLSDASSSPSSADVTQAVRAAILYETNTLYLVLESGTGGTINNFGVEDLENIEFIIY